MGSGCCSRVAGVKVNGRRKKSDFETSQLSLFLGQELLKKLSLSEHRMHFAWERQTWSLLSSCPGAELQSCGRQWLGSEQSLARKRGTGSAGGGPAGGVSSRAVPKQPWKQGLSLAWGWAQEERSWCCLPQLTHPPLECHTASCHRKFSCPSAPWSPGSGAGRSQPLVQMLAGWERGTGREQGLSLSQSVQMGISRAKRGDLWPRAPEGVGPAPRSGEGAGTQSGGELLHSIATLAPVLHPWQSRAISRGRPTQIVMEESTEPAQLFWNRGAQQSWAGRKGLRGPLSVALFSH